MRSEHSSHGLDEFLAEVLSPWLKKKCNFNKFAIIIASLHGNSEIFICVLFRYTGQ
jgi:hypothetical protein